MIITSLRSKIRVVFSITLLLLGALFVFSIKYDQAMIETGIYEGRQVPAPGREGEMQDYGWLEHTARRVSAPVRTQLRRVLEQQGFALE